MEFIFTTELSSSSILEALRLWDNEYPENLAFHSQQDFEVYLNKLSRLSHIFMVNEKKEVIGWYFDFIREEERWFGIIIDSHLQGKGLGSEILNLAKQKESVLNGWVIDHDKGIKQNGQVYRSPLTFYLKNKFELLPNVRLEEENISAVKIRWSK